MLKPRSYRPFALAALAASALLLTDAAHAAAVLLLSSDLGQAHTCRARVHDRYDMQLAQTTYLRVDTWGAIVSLGELPLDAHGDTPRFGSLTVTCWEPTTTPAGTPPPATAPSYSVTFGYLDPGWFVPNADGTGHVRTLPRNGRTLHLRIERTDNPQRLFRITDATLREGYPPAPVEAFYGTLLHRYLDAD